MNKNDYGPKFCMVIFIGDFLVVGEEVNMFGLST